MSALPQSVVLVRPGAVPPGPVPETADWATALARLDSIVGLLTSLVRAAEANAAEATARERYTTEEVARKFRKRPRTPQKWCRDRQVHCIRITRDGTYRITKEEVERIRSHGLLAPGRGRLTEE